MNNNLIRLKFFIVIFLSITIFPLTGAISQEYIEIKTISLYETFKTTLRWHVTAYQAKNVETSYQTAKLCFWHDPEKKEQFCFKAVDDHVGKEEHYSYYLVKDIKIVPLQKIGEPKHGILFVAENHAFSAGGFLIYASIWSYGKREGKFVKILPSIRITDQGAFRVIPALTNKIQGVFVKADYIWEEGEGRYDYHKYNIQIYKLGEEGTFRIVGQYITKSKYNVEAEDVDVIKHEFGSIQNYISNKIKK